MKNIGTLKKLIKLAKKDKKTKEEFLIDTIKYFGYTDIRRFLQSIGISKGIEDFINDLENLEEEEIEEIILKLMFYIGEDFEYFLCKDYIIDLYFK